MKNFQFVHTTELKYNSKCSPDICLFIHVGLQRTLISDAILNTL